jgi:hypothetical protein
VWFPLQWSGTPRETEEIVIIVTVNKVTKKARSVETSIATEWIIGGLNGYVRSLASRFLPSGAFITGHNVNSPNCPSPDQESFIVFKVLAMPEGHLLKSYEAIGLPTIEVLEASALASGSLLTVYGG